MIEMAEKLMVIDMQNDFISGTLANPEAVKIIPAVVAKIEAYKKANKDIYITQDSHNQNYLNTSEGKYLPIEHCLMGTDGWKLNSEIAKALDGYGNVHFINKQCFGFEWWKHYPSIKCGCIELCGIDSDICVVSNGLILKALYPDMRIIVDEECIAGSSVENNQAAINVMKACQIEFPENIVEPVPAPRYVNSAEMNKTHTAVQ